MTEDHGDIKCWLKDVDYKAADYKADGQKIQYNNHPMINDHGDKVLSSAVIQYRMPAVA